MRQSHIDKEDLFDDFVESCIHDVVAVYLEGCSYSDILEMLDTAKEPIVTRLLSAIGENEAVATGKLVLQTVNRVAYKHCSEMIREDPDDYGWQY